MKQIVKATLALFGWFRARLTLWTGWLAWIVAFVGSLSIVIYCSETQMDFGFVKISFGVAPSIEVLGALASILAVIVSVLVLATEKRREVVLLRYEAVRAKRATAKGILAEIQALSDFGNIRQNEPVTQLPSVLSAYSSEIGRLSRDTSSAVMKFYLGLPESGGTQTPDDKARADQAIIALNLFLEKTEPESNKLKWALGL